MQQVWPETNFSLEDGRGVRKRQRGPSSALKVKFSLRYLFLPDPLAFVRSLSYGSCDPSNAYPMLMKTMLRFAALFLVLQLVVILFDSTMPEAVTLSLHIPTVRGALQFLWMIIGFTGIYLYLLVTCQQLACRILIRALCCDRDDAEKMVNDYGGRKLLLADVAKRFDTNCQRVVSSLLEKQEVLRVQLIARCLNTNFFTWVRGDDTSLQVFLVTLIMTAMEPHELNDDPVLRKALRNTLQKAKPLSDVLAEYAYPDGPSRSIVQSAKTLIASEDDYGKVMLALSAYLLDGEGKRRARLLHATMSGVGTDERNLSRLLLCCSKNECNDMRKAYNEMYGTGALIRNINEETGGAPLSSAVNTAFNSLSSCAHSVFGGDAPPTAQKPSNLYNEAIRAIIGGCRDDVDMWYFNVKQAKNLPKKDFKGWGKNDPFVHIRIGEAVLRTRTLKDEGNNPIWNQELGPIMVRRAAFGSADDPRLVLVDVRVFDKDPIGVDTFGQINAKCLSEMPLISEYELALGPVLSVTVISAKNLPDKDTIANIANKALSSVADAVSGIASWGWNSLTGGNGSGTETKAVARDPSTGSDPYVKVSVCESHKRTTTVNNDANPQWPNGGEELQLEINGGDELVKIEVFDDDCYGAEERLGCGESLGHCEINFRKRIENGQMPIEVKLKGSGSDSTIKVKLSLSDPPTGTNGGTLTLETCSYQPGEAPWEQNEEELNSKLEAIMENMKDNDAYQIYFANQVRLLKLLCFASDKVLGSKFLKKELLQKVRERLLPPGRVAKVVEHALGFCDIAFGAELTDVDDLKIFWEMLVRDNTKEDDAPFSERYLHELRECIRPSTGFSIDELGLIVLLSCIEPKHKKALEDMYSKEFHDRTLRDDLLDATSDSPMLEALLLGFTCADNDWLWARTLYEAMKGGWTGAGTDESTLTDILCINHQHLTGVMDRYLEISTKRGSAESLQEAVKGETSGPYQYLLMQLLRLSKARGRGS